MTLSLHTDLYVLMVLLDFDVHNMTKTIQIEKSKRCVMKHRLRSLSFFLRVYIMRDQPDLGILQSLGDVQLHFHVHQPTLSPVLLCVLVHYYPETQHQLQGTAFEPLGAHGPPERFASP